jgi:hypothetical protein
MQIPVNQVVNVEPNNFQGLTKTTFLSSASNNQPVYMFHQPQNAPQVGSTLDGTIAPDQRGALKFTKTPNPQYANSGNFSTPAYSSPIQNYTPSGQTSTAGSSSSTDPRQESIEKQAYFKAAIDVYNVWKTTGSQETLDVFATNLVKTALTIKRQMKDNANGDVVIKDIPAGDPLTQLGDIFGPGTQEVLAEGPNGL